VRVTRHVDLTLENGRHLQLEHAIVIDFPPIFEELRIAGLLSPQSFAPENLAAILDLRAPSLTIEPFQKAIDRLHIAPMPEGRVCERNFYAIPIFAAGGRGFALLDTGATGTVIAPESQIAKALESRSIEGKHTQGVGGKIIENVPRRSMEALQSYSWPGNVRELRNVIERSMILTDGPTLHVALPDRLDVGRVVEPASTLEEVERRHVLRVLEACNGNRTDAAKMLGLDRKTLYRKLLRWGVSE